MSVYQEWLNENAYRAFPLKEDTPRIATSDDSVTLPNYVFVDFVLTMAGAADVRVYLHDVAQVAGFLSCTFVDDDGNTVTTLAVDANVHTPNQGYALIGQGVYEDARGRAVLGNLATLRTDLPDGKYTFEAELESGTVRPALRGVRSLQLGSGDTLSERITGHVKLLEGTNIRLTYLPAYNMIRIDAIQGAGLNEQDCDCADQYSLPSPIRRVNGINIEDLQIVGDGKCLEVVTSGSKIQLRDTCSQPCCGCPELEFITTNLELLQSTLSRVEALATMLQERYQEFIEAILASTRGSG